MNAKSFVFLIAVVLVISTIPAKTSPVFNIIQDIINGIGGNGGHNSGNHNYGHENNGHSSAITNSQQQTQSSSQQQQQQAMSRPSSSSTLPASSSTSSLSEFHMEAYRFRGAAYCLHKPETPFVDLKTRQVRMIDFFSHPFTGIAGYTALDHERKEILVVFRGTAHPGNWAMNLQFHKRTADYCTNHHGEIHCGFLEAYSSIQQEVKASIIRLVNQYRSYHIAFVGHSLGGALATIAIGDAFSILPNKIGYLEETFRNYKKDKATLFTVGAPRIGDVQFAYNFAAARLKATYRLVRNKDIVPHLPPPYFGYHHSPKEYWITSAGHVVHCDDITNKENYGEDTNCANMYASKPLEWSIPEHMDYFNITLNFLSRQCV